ncbi:hypothetical protein DsansV1_C38g0235171 [Dioscorea sansibarensis]
MASSKLPSTIRSALTSLSLSWAPLKVKRKLTLVSSAGSRTVARTLWPSSSKALTRYDPINPVPPVTQYSIPLSLSLSFSGFSQAFHHINSMHRDTRVHTYVRIYIRIYIHNSVFGLLRLNEPLIFILFK